VQSACRIGPAGASAIAERLLTETRVQETSVMTDRKLYLGPLTDKRRWDMVDIIFLFEFNRMRDHVDDEMLNPNLSGNLHIGGGTVRAEH
jgi:hypothetical protein